MRDKGKTLGTLEPILDVINSANERVFIQNPYILLTKELREALQKAAARGVDITVITNSPMSNDMKLVGAAWPESRKFLASIGANVFEHTGPGAEAKAAVAKEAELDLIKKLTASDPAFKDVIYQNMAKWNLRSADNAIKFETAIHKKVTVGDDRLLIESFNLDPRSQKHNLEVVYEIKSNGMAQKVVNSAYAEVNKYKYVQTIKKGKTIAKLPNRPCKYKIIANMIYNLL